MSLFHVWIPKDATWTFPIPRDWTTAFYVIAGSGQIPEPNGGNKSVSESHYVLYESETGDHVRVKNVEEKTLELYFLAGKPFKEPVVHRGHFVMNTKQELQQGEFYEDY